VKDFDGASLPSVALDKGFAECNVAFAECNMHSANRAAAVVVDAWMALSIISLRLYP
jgi:hypothetical protein